MGFYIQDVADFRGRGRTRHPSKSIRAFHFLSELCVGLCAGNPGDEGARGTPADSAWICVFFARTPGYLALFSFCSRAPAEGLQSNYEGLKDICAILILIALLVKVLSIYVWYHLCIRMNMETEMEMYTPRYIFICICICMCVHFAMDMHILEFVYMNAYGTTW